MRGARPLSEVTGSARMELTLTVASEAALPELALALPAEPRANGEVVATLLLGEGRHARVLLGRNFALDGELTDRISEIAGVSNVALKARAVPQMKLVA